MITFPGSPTWFGLGWVIALVVLIVAVVLLFLSNITPMLLLLLIIGLTLARLL